MGPLLISLVFFITLLGHIVGRLESWDKLDAIYWAFITATTVGYGDIRPMGRLSKGLSVFIALVGMVFTGIMVALAVNAVTDSYHVLKLDT
ncbi:MAG: potassium channel family protein [Gammaproteobacteria bacterium]